MCALPVKVTQGGLTTAKVLPTQEVLVSQYRVNTQSAVLENEIPSVQATVIQGGLTTAKVLPNQEVLVTQYRVNTNSLGIADLGDVSTDGLTDGALLSYNAALGIWITTNVISNANTEFNGGFF